jgi:hypothetical protein
MSHATSTLRLPCLESRLLVLGDPHGDAAAVDLVLEDRRPVDVVDQAFDGLGISGRERLAELGDKIWRPVLLLLQDAFEGTANEPVPADALRSGSRIDSHEKWTRYVNGRGGHE